MDEEQVCASVRELDTTRATDQEAAWDRLRPLGEAGVPYLREYHRRPG